MPDLKAAHALLKGWRDDLRDKEKAKGVSWFCGFPEAWVADPHFMCVNGHVSGNILSSEEEGDLCLACRQPTVLGPLMGEGEFGPIAEIMRFVGETEE